jgi:DNA modification methylase
MNITTEPGLGRFMTFEASKEKPVHGWFWYKEGYAPEIVERAISDFRQNAGREPGTILDPFCGVGTTLLAAKEKGLPSAGIDASPLAVFVSKTKTDDYDGSDAEAALAFLSRRLDYGSVSGREWDFELFPPRAAFPKRNLTEILALRQAIEREDGRARNILLLALLSILPQASIMVKDGGVLKIERSKRALPAREIFRRKVKRMVRELSGRPQGHSPHVFLGDARALDLDGESADMVVTSPPYLNNIDYSKIYGLELSGRPQGHSPHVFLGDARALDLDGESADMVVTSPPYLNNIDYSKIYGLELSLLAMSKAVAEEVRMRAVRSFIGRRMDVGRMPPEVGDEGYRIPIIGTYFRDMEASIAEMLRVLRPGGSAYIVVSNSVIHQTHVMVDEIFAQMGQRLGFTESRIVVGAERVADVRPQRVRTRESMVVLRR